MSNPVTPAVPDPTVEALWPPAGSFHWRCAEALLKITRWDEWRRWGLKRQSDEITALAAALAQVIPEGDVGRWVDRAVAAEVGRARAAVPDALRVRVEALAAEWASARSERATITRWAAAARLKRALLED